MRLDFLELIRCPYCGGRVELVRSAFHRIDGDDLQDGILGCHCCAFPVVAGIPVLHLEPPAARAREHIDGGEPDRALQALFGIDEEARARAFAETIASADATYRQVVEVLGPTFEGGYFLYRFSDPTYVVAQAVVRALASAARGEADLTAIDVCGGSGHLTRTLAEFAHEPVLADLYFSKLWLAKRFTAPTCQPVCCDGNAPLPFRAGTFRLAVCSDAFHYIWTKRLLADEMMRLAGADGIVALTHIHNERQWNPSAGMPLPPEAYADLFATLGARVLSERRLLGSIVADGTVDLASRDDRQTLDADPALTLVASTRAGVFASHAVVTPAAGRLRVNPLYVTERTGAGLRCVLRFPSPDYADEYGACRTYLPDEITLGADALAALEGAPWPADVSDLVRRRVLVDLPDGYC